MTWDARYAATLTRENSPLGWFTEPELDALCALPRPLAEQLLRQHLDVLSRGSPRYYPTPDAEPVGWRASMTLADLLEAAL